MEERQSAKLELSSDWGNIQMVIAARKIFGYPVVECELETVEKTFAGDLHYWFSSATPMRALSVDMRKWHTSWRQESKRRRAEFLRRGKHGMRRPR